MRINNILEGRLDSPALAALKATGVINDSKKETRLERILEEHGLSLEETIEDLSRIAKFAEKEETKLRATELALKLNGVMKDDIKREAPQVIFRIEASGNVSLNQIFCPER